MDCRPPLTSSNPARSIGSPRSSHPQHGEMPRRDSTRGMPLERGQGLLVAAAGRHDFSCGRIRDIDWGALEVLKRDASSHLAVGVARSAAVASPGGVRVAGTGGGADADANLHGLPDLDFHEHSYSFTYVVTDQYPDAHPGAHTYAARAPAGGGDPPRSVALLAGGSSVGGERRVFDTRPGLRR